jgi:hypothetical protein
MHPKPCLKNGDGWYSRPSLLSRSGSCSRHISAAMSQACHIGCWWVGGSRGSLQGPSLHLLSCLSMMNKSRLSKQ